MPSTALCLMAPRPRLFCSRCFFSAMDTQFKLLLSSFFSLVGLVIQKIREDEATAILVAPLWRTQSWYPTVLSMLVGYPVVFPARRANLYLPHKPTETHPLSDNLRLMAVKVSGDCSQAIDFRRQHREWSSQHGGRTPSVDMRRSLPGGKTIVVERDVIPYTPL